MQRNLVDMLLEVRNTRDSSEANEVGMQAHQGHGPAQPRERDDMQAEPLLPLGKALRQGREARLEEDRRELLDAILAAATRSSNSADAPMRPQPPIAAGARRTYGSKAAAEDEAWQARRGGVDGHGEGRGSGRGGPMQRRGRQPVRVVHRHHHHHYHHHYICDDASEVMEARGSPVQDNVASAAEAGAGLDVADNAASGTGSEDDGPVGLPQQGRAGEAGGAAGGPEQRILHYHYHVGEHVIPARARRLLEDARLTSREEAAAAPLAAEGGFGKGAKHSGVRGLQVAPDTRLPRLS